MLVEGKLCENGLLEGLGPDNYLTVRCVGPVALQKTICPVKITEAENGELLGELSSSARPSRIKLNDVPVSLPPANINANTFLPKLLIDRFPATSFTKMSMLLPSGISSRWLPPTCLS